jgi:hypothetical protein
LAEGDTAHLANYHGFRYAKEEMWKQKPQETPRNTSGRVFSSNLIKLCLFFTAALRGHTDQRIHQEVAESTSDPELPKPNNRKQVSQFELSV